MKIFFTVQVDCTDGLEVCVIKANNNKSGFVQSLFSIKGSAVVKLIPWSGRKMAFRLFV
jgi:hypothetical protein